jgi:hypothetical protein
VRYCFEPFSCDEPLTGNAETVPALINALKRGVKVSKEFYLTVDQQGILFSHCCVSRTFVETQGLFTRPVGSLGALN